MRLTAKASQASPRRRWSAVVVAAVMALGLSACGDDGGAASQATQARPQSVSEADWNKVLEAAKSEGTVVVYASVDNVERTFGEFTKAYGINVTTVRAPTGELIPRLDQEIEVGAKGADVTTNSQVLWFDDKDKQGQLAGLKLSPEAVKDGWEARLNGSNHPLYYSYHFSIAYNTHTAKPVKSVQEIIDTAAPTTKIGMLDAGSPSIDFQYQTWLDAYGPDTLKKLSKFNTTVLPSTTPLSQGLAAGEFDYVLGMIAGTINALQEKDAPVDQVVPDANTAGVYYPIAALANAGHPNAAQVFVNWMLDPNGGMKAMAANHRPASVPLPITGVPPTVPWGAVKTYDPKQWTKQYTDAWLAKEWNPIFKK